MNTTTANPLRKHFRQPVIYLRLPSLGKFYPQGALMLPPNGEIPILPMTAIDEITSRTPDALFNGSAVMEIISSCVPNLRDPWSIPSVDINAYLIAVRMASYGHEIEISSKCPKCGEDHTVTLDLRVVLDGLKCGNYEQPISIGDLTIHFEPTSYRQINENSRINFEDQKLIQMLNASDTPEEEKMTHLGNAFRRITEMTIKSISDTISAINTNDAMVTDRTHIEEFLHNCPKHVFDAIKEHAIKLKESSDIPPLSLTCPSCSNQYKQEFSLDMSNFFVTAS